MKWKSLFVEEEAARKQLPSSPAAQVITPAIAATFTAGVDPDIKAALIQSMADKKLPGYDYLKYVASLEEMKSMVPAEDARFKMAFITAKQLGIDKKKLAESGQHYLQVLDEDAKEFQANFGQKFQEAVTTKEKQLADIDAQVKSFQEEIEKLSANIQAAQTQRTEIASQVAENRAKLDMKKQSFEVTQSSCVAEIQGNIEKLNKYL